MSRKNSILCLFEPEKKMNFLIFYTYEHLKELNLKKNYKVGPRRKLPMRIGEQLRLRPMRLENLTIPLLKLAKEDLK